MEWTCVCGRAFRLLLSTVSDQEPAVRVSEQPVVHVDGPSLTDFQLRVLELIAGGLTDGRAARVLDVSIHAVRYAMRDVMTRLSTRSRAEAVFVASSLGFIGRSNQRIREERHIPNGLAPTIGAART